jgi:tetratricopeptide (TPR) repeat protein
MFTQTRRFVINPMLILVLLGSVPCLSQDINPRAKKYYSLLIRQPSSEFVYDRFYDAWLDSGTLEGLEGFLRSQVEQQPNTANRILLAFFCERQGRDIDALALYRAAAQRDPLNGDILLQKARAEVRTLDFDTAITDLGKARKLSLKADLAEKIDKLLGRLYVRTMQKDKAQAIWRQLLQAHPDDEDLMEDLIELQLSEGLYEEAIAFSDQLLQRTRDPYLQVVRRLRKGDLYQYSGKDSQALEVYTRCLDLVGQGTWLENQICAQMEQVFRREDNLTALKDFYARLIEQHGQRVSLKTKLARLLVQMDRTPEALVLLQQILAITPGDKANQVAYVEALVKADQLAKAIEVTEQLVQRHGQDRELLIQLAELYHQNKQAQPASRTLITFLEKSDQTEYVFLRVARILERYSLHTEAAGVYEQMITAVPDSLTAKEAYAVFLYRCDKKEQALAVWKSIADSDDLFMLLRASQAAARRGHRELALQWLESQYDRFSHEVSYMGRLCEIGLRLERFDETLPRARHQLAISERFSHIQVAVSQVVTLAKKADTVDVLIKELESTTSRTPRDTCLLSELLESAGLGHQADQLLARASVDDQDVLLKQQIRLYRLRRDWLNAAETTQQLIAQAGTRDSMYLRDLVDLYRKANAHEKALQWIPPWKKALPSSTTPWLSEAQLLGALGRDSEAINVLRRADQAFEGRTDILSRLAHLYSGLGRFTDAQRIYWRLYENAKDAADKLQTVRNLGQAARTTEQREAIVERLKQRQRGNQTSVIPCLALAEIYRQMNRYEDRRQALLDATRIRADDMTLLHEIARIEETEGDWEGAVNTLKKAIELDPTDKTRQLLARLHLQYGDEAEGYRILFDLSGGTGMNAREVEAMVDTMMSVQNWDMALRFLEDLLPQHPRDYKLHYLHAVALEEDGRDQEALDAFITLLSLKEEIPGNTSQPTASPWASAGWNIADLMPPDSMALMELQSHFSRSYQYRQQRQISSYLYIGRTGQGATIAVPPCVEDVSGFAISHILTIAQLLNDETGARVQEALRQHGIANADVLMSMSSYGMEGLSRGIDDLALQYPQNDSVQAMWVLYRVQGDQGQAEQWKQAFELFVQPWPRLAMMAGLTYSTLETEESAGPIRDRSLEILRGLDQPGPYESMVIASVLQKPTEGMALTEAHRDVLIEVLLSWYPMIRNNPSIGPYLFTQIARGLIPHREGEAFVQFLDEEVRQQLSAPATSGSSRSRSNRLIVPLSYPPQSLPGFPDMITQLVLRGSDPQYRSSSREVPVDPDTLFQHMDKVTNPILKVLIALSADHQARAQALLDAQLRAESPSLTALVLSASLVAEQEKPKQAMSLLERARYLPMASQQRQTIDAALVAYAMELDPNTDPNHVAIGRQAALRLRRNRLNPDQREDLIDALETLGLADDAAQLARQVSPIRTGVSSSAQRTVMSRSSSSSQGRIETLLDKKQIDAALRLAQADLRVEAVNTLYPQFTNRYGSSRTQDLIDLLIAHKLTDRFLTMVDPGQTQSLRKLLEYARMCELLNERDKARQAYERALERRPKDSAARIHLALLLGATDAQAGARHLGHLDTRTVNQAGPALAGYIQNKYHDRSVDEALDVLAVVAAYLGTKPDTQRLSLLWVPNVLETISQSYYGDQTRLGHLYQRSDSRSDEHVKLAQRRRELHQVLCRTMLDIPQLSPMGFAHLWAEAKARDAVSDEFPALAKAALLLHKPFKGPYGSQGPRYSYSSSSSYARPMRPDEFLVRYAGERGDLESLVSEMGDQFRVRGHQDDADQFERLARLYLVDASAFLESAAELIDGIPRRVQQQPGSLDTESALVLVIDAYAYRRLDVPVVAFLLKRLKQGPAGNVSVNQWHVRHCLGQVMNRDLVQGKAFLEALVTRSIGPQEKRSRLVEKHYDPRRGSSNTINGQIHQCFDLLRNYVSHRGMFFFIMAYVQDMPALAQRIQSNVDSRLRSLTRSSDPNEIMMFLRASPFLGDIETFNTLPLTGVQYNSVYAHVVRGLRESTSRMRGASATVQGMVRPLGRAGAVGAIFRGGTMSSAVVAQAKPTESSKEAAGSVKEQLLRKLEQQSACFGRDLLLAQLSDEPEIRVHEVMAPYMGRFAQLPAAGQRQVAFMIEDTLRGQLYIQGNWSQPAQAAFTTMAGIRKQKDRDQVAAFLAVKTFQSLKLEARDFDDYVTGMLDGACAQDPKSAKKVLVKADELVTAAIKRNQWNYSTNITERIIDRMGRQRDSLSPLALMVDLIRDVNAPAMRIRQHSVDRHTYSVYSIYRGFQNKSTPNALDQLKQLYEAMGQAFGPGNLSGVTGCLRQAFDSMGRTPNDVNALLTWSKEQMDTGEYPGLAREFYLHATLKQLRNQHPRNEQQVELQQAYDALLSYYESVLADDSLSVRWRLMTANALRQLDRYLCPDRLVFKAIALLIQAWNNGEDLDEEHFRDMLRQLVMLSEVDHWQQTAANLTKAYFKRIAKTKQYYSSSVQLSLLEINLLLGNDDTVLRLVKRQDLARVLDAWVLLVQYDKLSQAQTFIRTGWKNVNTSYSGRGQYTEAFGKQLARCLEGIDEPDIRYFGRVMMSSLRDSQGAPSALSQSERMAHCGAQFKEIPFRSAALRRRTLLHLTGFNSALPAISEFLAKEAEALDVDVILTESQSGSQRQDKETKKKVLLAYYTERILAGDPNACVQGIQQICQAIKRDTRGRSYEHAEMLETLARRLGETHTHLASTWTVPHMAALMTVSSALIDSLSSSDHNWHYRSELVGHSVIFHVLAGEVDQANALLNGIDEKTLQKVEHNTRMSTLHRNLAKWMGQRPFLEKLEIIKRFYTLKRMTDELAQSKARYSALYNLSSNKVLSRQEILTHGPDLVTLAEPIHRSWQFLANLQEEEGDIEGARASYLLALAACQQPYSVWARAKPYSLFLQRHGKPGEALAYLKGFDTENWPGKRMQQYREYFKKVQELK